MGGPHLSERPPGVWRSPRQKEPGGAPEKGVVTPPEEKCSLLGQGDNRREGHNGKALSNPLQPHHQRQGSPGSPTGTREYEAVSWLNSPFFPLSLHPSSESTPEGQEPVALAGGGNYRSKLK